MEKRKEAIRGFKVCRFCLTQDRPLTSIYDRSRMSKTTVSLPMQIMTCVAIEVFPSDGMPSLICERCRFFMDQSYLFKQVCRQADEMLLQFVQSGEYMDGVTWPDQLLQTMRLVGGETEIKAEEKQSPQASDTDEDTDVVNIKIETDGRKGRGSEKTARIKVVPTGGGLHITSEDDKPAKKTRFSSGPKLARHVRSHAGARAFPCKYCNKSFIKSHHYTRHLRIKHGHQNMSPRGPFGASEQYRCDQCIESFETQDELFYHSAIHATQNLTCPLCRERFPNVDAVTAHIKSHVEGEQYMCDLCELVFTSEERLDVHLQTKHEDELKNEEELSAGAEDSQEESQDGDDDHIEEKPNLSENTLLKLPNLDESTEELEKTNTNSEESESEATFTELSTVDTLAIAKLEVSKTIAAQEKAPVKSPVKPVEDKPKIVKKIEPAKELKLGGILRKAEEVKKRAVQEKKVDSSNEVEKETAPNASDKSLRLLEKELQDLKRTSARGEAGIGKTDSRVSAEMSRIRRHPMHGFTPKPRQPEAEKKLLFTKTAEKRPLERRLIKENKEREPKESKDNKEKETISHKESKNREFKEGRPQDIRESKGQEVRESKSQEIKDSKSLEVKAAKVVPKNGKSGKEDPSPRRSSRPCKVKDYAKMIRESQTTDESEEEESEEEAPPPPVQEKTPAKRGRPRKILTPSASVATPVVEKQPAAVADKPPGQRRGRPPKAALLALKRKSDAATPDPPEEAPKPKTPKQAVKEEVEIKSNAAPATPPVAESPKSVATPQQAVLTKIGSPGKVVLSPSGQTLTRVPASVIKALPPGVKPMPLPRQGQTCEMKIGQKTVKVQKIVMTKAEVEAMAKKGLLEMKDGTMILKQGIKLPVGGNTAAIKSTLVGDVGGATVPKSPAKETPVHPPAPPPVPTRCDLEEET